MWKRRKRKRVHSIFDSSSFPLSKVKSYHFRLSCCYRCFITATQAVWRLWLIRNRLCADLRALIWQFMGNAFHVLRPPTFLGHHHDGWNRVYNQIRQWEYEYDEIVPISVFSFIYREDFDARNLSLWKGVSGRNDRVSLVFLHHKKDAIRLYIFWTRTIPQCEVRKLFTDQDILFFVQRTAQPIRWGFWDNGKNTTVKPPCNKTDWFLSPEERRILE